MQQGGDDGGGVEFVFGEDARHLDGMGEIGITGRPKLSPVHLHRVDIGAVEQGLVRARVVLLDPLDQLELAQVTDRLARGRYSGFSRREDRIDGKGGPEVSGRDRLEGERFCAGRRQ